MRVLILSTPVGESHSAMARALARDLERCEDISAVTVIDDFEVLGRRLGGFLERGFRRHLGEARRSYDVAYWLFSRVAPARGLGELALYRLGGDALAATIACHAPDVVISTYPVLNSALARLRRAGRLACPAAGVVGPLGGLSFWAARGLDLYMLNYPEASEEVRRRTRGGRVVAVRPLVREEFLSCDDGADAWRELAAADELVVVSGGGWGAGDLEGAIEACLAIEGTHVVAIAGRNEAMCERLRARYRDQARLTVLGFTDEMPALLRAAGALVTATAGLSCVEARLCGCAAICYGFPVGHVRDNAAALARHGLARTATTRAELTGALREALAAGRRTVALPDGLPAAADVVAELARAHLAGRSGERPHAAGRGDRRAASG